MEMEAGTFLVSLLSPLCMIILGAVYMKRQPEGPNWVTGIRTRKSLQNRKTWEFAHRFGGKLLLAFGLFLLPASAVAMLLMLRHGRPNAELASVIVVGVQLFFFILTTVLTDAAIKRNFDSEGMPN